MNCKNATKLISKYFDKQTDSETNNLLFEHINICPNCKKEFDILNKIFNNLPKKQTVTLNPYFNQKLKSHIFNKQNKFFTNQVLKPVGIFFSIVTLLFVLSFSLKRNIINISQKSFNNKDIVDDDVVIFDLIELAHEINNEIYILKEG